jgi:hypothetical protein
MKHFDVGKVVDRLLTEPDSSVRSIAKEIGISASGLNRRVSLVMTPKQRANWIHKIRSESAKRSQTTRRIGAVVVRDGRRWIKTASMNNASGRNWRHLARWKWETVRGPIPKGSLLWYRDGDPMNDELENLEVVTFQEKLRRVRLRPDVEQRRKTNAAASRNEVRALRRAAKEIRDTPIHPPNVEQKAPAKSVAAQRLAAFLESLEAA